MKTARHVVWRLTVWSLVVALALGAGTALLLLPGGGKAGVPTTEALLVAALAPSLSEDDINALAWDIWARPEVDRVNFRFPGEVDPVPVEDRTLVIKLAGPGERATVEDVLRAASGITAIRYLERTIKPPPRLPALARVLALVGLALALAAALLLGKLSMERLAGAWGDALAVLRASGVSETQLRVPFASVGGLVGLFGGLIYCAALWTALSLVGDSPQVRELLPELGEIGPIATALGLAVGALLGALGGLLGFPSGKPHS